MMERCSSEKRDDRHGKSSVKEVIQLDLHDGRLGRAWLAPTQIQPARRHARPDGQADGEIIETPITANFREGLTVLAVLHLDARRPQGSGRHGAEDGELGLSHASSRRRRAGSAIVTQDDCGTHGWHRGRSRRLMAVTSSQRSTERTLRPHGRR
jgi:hypothetical protein